MARNATATANTDQSTNRRGYWQEELAKAEKRWSIFSRNGNVIEDRYRQEREQSEQDIWQDRYNILYSSTETIRPSLYAQTPKVQAVKRHRDRTNDYATFATMLIETVTQYALEEIDFDGVMKNVVQDYLLPGLGAVWVRYVPTISTRNANDNDGNSAYETVDFEGLDVDYVHYKDFRTGVCRTWKECPWVARRVYFSKSRALKRFGAEKANRLKYSYRPSDDGSGNRDMAGIGGAQSIIWEIWDRENRKVVWYSDDYEGDLLDEIDDPLHLKDFFPCPEPIRAVWSTRTFVPKAFYSQYRAQAEELNNLTERIRYLTQALRAIGVYDGSQDQLQNILQGKGNKLVPVENWAAFASQGGIQGSIQWVPIKDVAEVLMSLLQQRDIVKGEIYEITGFSDIVRGISKASETLGAQQLKADWASARLREMQKEVQRFCRDIFRIMSEIICEQFSEESLALYSGFDPPEVTPEEQQQAAQYAAAVVQYQNAQTLPVPPGTQPPQPPQRPAPTMRQQALEAFAKTVQLLKNEKRRCALIGIETDSTIQPDEQAERQDRMDFLGAAGAFLQQAGPMALQYPDMRGLLGAILMFTIRTFRASRPLEKEFEDFTKKLEQQPATPPPGQEGQGDGGAAVAQAQVQSEQIKAQAQAQKAQADAQSDKYKVDTEAQLKREQMKLDHDYRMAELAIREREVAIRERELGIDVQQMQHDNALELADQQHRRSMDAGNVARQDRDFAAGREDADRQFEQQAKQPQKQA